MLERRKVYIEFTGRSSAQFVTPYRSKEYEFKPSDDFKVIDLITLKEPQDGEDCFFRAIVRSESDTANINNQNYSINVYVYSGLYSDGSKQYSHVGTVRLNPDENKRKFEVSYKT